MKLGWLKFVIAAVLATMVAQPALATGSGDSKKKPAAAPVSQPTAPAVLKLGIGRAVKLDGFELTLNKVVQPGAEALGGGRFTEYNLTVTNTSPDKDLLISNATISVAGEVRSAVRDLDDIVFQESMSDKTAVASAGAGAVGFIGGLLGPIGAIGSMVAVNKGATKVFVDDPQKWRDELKRRGFPGANEAGVSAFPTESTTGSIWFKQAESEVAGRMQVYVKQGGTSRIIRLDLVDMPAAVAKSE